uniref:ATP synthase F(1) complex subunit delta, mitochondrial n=1 Tax=Cyprinus carpio carpio TaxID=630221 RepID=A0A9J8BND3_CYPCA
MMAARFLLRRAVPALRHARCYADAPAAQMSFTFASPTQVFFKEASVKQIDVPTLTGAFGILPAHVPTLQVLRPGVVTVFGDDGSSTKYFEIHPEGVRIVPQVRASSSINRELSYVLEIKHGLCFAVSSGSVTVNADSSVQLLAEEAVPLDSLDLAVSPCYAVTSTQGNIRKLIQAWLHFPLFTIHS